MQVMSTSQTKILSPIKIVLVEDNEHDRVAFRRAFERGRVECEIATYDRARDAFEKLHSDPSACDIAVIDHGLPGMSGLALCEALLAEESSVPLVILTGQGSEQLAVEALKMGVDDYIVKDSLGHYLVLLPIVIPAILQNHNDRLARKLAERALQEAYDELETRVKARTMELADKTQQLKSELAKRMQAEGEVRHLSRQLLRATETERKRLARDLHDEFGQALTALHFGMESLHRSLPEELKAHRKQCQELIGLVETLGDNTRRISAELRPDMLDHLGLIPTLESYVWDFAKRVFGVDVKFHASGVRKHPPPEVGIVLYRILQEALNNVAKHANATKVSVLLAYSHPNFILTVQDDGVGFETETRNGTPSVQEQGIGLLGMRERVGIVGGIINIQSTPGKGTFIRVEIPVSGELPEGRS
jgi:signal transduction histidine kinase